MIIFAAGRILKLLWISERKKMGHNESFKFIGFSWIATWMRTGQHCMTNDPPMVSNDQLTTMIEKPKTRICIQFFGETMRISKWNYCKCKVYHQNAVDFFGFICKDLTLKWRDPLTYVQNERLFEIYTCKKIWMLFFQLWFSFADYSCRQYSTLFKKWIC